MISCEFGLHDKSSTLMTTSCHRAPSNFYHQVIKTNGLNYSMKHKLKSVSCYHEIPFEDGNTECIISIKAYYMIIKIFFCWTFTSRLLMVSKITILKFLIQMRPILCIQIYFFIRRCCWGTKIVANSKIFM